MTETPRAVSPEACSGAAARPVRWRYTYASVLRASHVVLPLRTSPHRWGQQAALLSVCALAPAHQRRRSRWCTSPHVHIDPLWRCLLRTTLQVPNSAYRSGVPSQVEVSSTGWLPMDGKGHVVVDGHRLAAFTEEVLGGLPEHEPFTFFSPSDRAIQDLQATLQKNFDAEEAQVPDVKRLISPPGLAGFAVDPPGRSRVALQQRRWRLAERYQIRGSREDGLVYPADTSRTNLSASLALLSRWRLSKP